MSDPNRLFKYFNKPPDRVVGFSADGFPVLAEVTPDLTQRQYEEDLVHACNYRAGHFDMADPVQADRYVDVMDHVANGAYYLKDRVVNFPDPAAAPRIWLEWTEVYCTPAGGAGYKPVAAPPAATTGA